MKDLILTGTLGTPHPYIARRIETEYWHHRSEWMEHMLAATVRNFEEAFGIGYSARILTATGDGGREAFITNLTQPGDIVWASPESVFEAIACTMGAAVEQVTESSFPKSTPKVVFLEHVSSNGSPVDLATTVSRIRKAHPTALVIADLAASYGADEIDFPALDCDGYLIVPERALGGIPGSCILIFRESVRAAARDLRKNFPAAPYALDILKYDKAWGNVTTPYSPNITACVALATALEIVQENGGLPQHAKRHAVFAEIFRSAMVARGCIMLPGARTHAFTVFLLPESTDAREVVRLLDTQGIGIDLFEGAKNAIRVGHMGFLVEEDIARFFSALSEILPGPIPSTALDVVAAPPAWDPKMRGLFSILPEELIGEAASAAKKFTDDQAYRAKIEASARSAFQTHQNYNLYGCFSTRTLGFIGAGNTVRESISRLQAAGVKDILVYSPSLAKLKKQKNSGRDVDNHKTLEYWESRGVTVATSSREVFLTAHTVVLLPTLYTRQAIELLRKPAEYYNEGLVDDALLTSIRDEGKMDLLINASAREGLIDRKALAKHLKQGWLKFVSDELPPVNDPAMKYPNAWITGHIGGSAKLTKQRIAENTHLLLEQFLTELKTGQPVTGESYVINHVNEHLLPVTGWRSAKGGQSEVRILLADLFDTATLDFAALEKKTGVKITIEDTSRLPRSESGLIESLDSFRPNILMIRTNTIITKRVATACVQIPELAAIIRPGVGIDNMYDGMEVASEGGIKIMNEPYGNSFSVGELTTHMVVNGIQKTLLAPGPTQFKPEIFEVMGAYTYPESQSYKIAYRRMTGLLRPWMDRGHDPITQSTPSTGLMEAGITNLTDPGARGFIVAHGKFGNRFMEIAQANGRTIDALSVTDEEWGRAFSPAEIRAAFKKDAARKTEPGYRPYSFLCFQQNETSSGVAYREKHIRAITRIARAYNRNIMIIMDGVSGVGAHSLNFANIDIDLAVIGSQKAFGISSGFTYGALSARAITYLLRNAGYEGSLSDFVSDPKRHDYLASFEATRRVRYHSLLRLLMVEADGSSDVPGIFHVLSTLASLRLMEAEGGRNAVARRHARLASYCRAETKRLNLGTLSHQPFVSDSVTPILTPKSKDAGRLRKELLDQYGFSVAGSQCDYWKPRLVRIGHVGFVSTPDIVRCMQGIRRLLR